eukprot:gnl/Dysnectes_brevis/1806_a2069_1728.p1 GENE.gnl/Dysnectes_brevis/1806_a2069_1728~~gnl/Dysnectes_brevis/1806_a2069_1728.p1  ORF type:complete len:458 (-),score=121.02 gnl/Dysnectes_brevis/1806_a2069_1728:83-1456(-)
MDHESYSVGQLFVQTMTEKHAKILEDAIPSSKSGARRKDRGDRATTNMVLDPKTRMMIFRLLDRGKILSLHGALSMGKEACVFITETPEGVAVLKVYSTSILAFKRRQRYIEGEHRFQHLRKSTRTNARQLVRLWCEKEFRNLKRLEKQLLLVPTAHFHHLHVLCMQFVGRTGSDGTSAAPTLKQALPHLSPSRRVKLYYSLIRGMREMWQGAGLVHGDLSEYNMLYYSKKLYIIDVSQSVDQSHPTALDLLREDILNVSLFFSRAGVPVLPCRVVLSFITSMRLSRSMEDEPTRPVCDALCPDGRHVDPQVVGRLRQLKREHGGAQGADEIARDREFLDTRIFKHYSDLSLEDIEKDRGVVKDETGLRNLGVILDDDHLPSEGDSEGPRSESGSEPAGTEPLVDVRESACLDRSRYSKAEWKRIQKEQRALRKAKIPNKIRKKEKRRARVVSKRKK